MSAIAPIWPIDRIRPEGKRKNKPRHPKELPRPLPKPPTKGKPGKRDDDK